MSDRQSAGRKARAGRAWPRGIVDAQRAALAHVQPQHLRRSAKERHAARRGQRRAGEMRQPRRAPRPRPALHLTPRSTRAAARSTTGRRLRREAQTRRQTLRSALRRSRRTGDEGQARARGVGGPAQHLRAVADAQRHARRGAALQRDGGAARQRRRACSRARARCAPWRPRATAPRGSASPATPPGRGSAAGWVLLRGQAARPRRAYVPPFVAC